MVVSKIEMPENVAMSKYMNLLNLLAFVNPTRKYKNGVVENEDGSLKMINGQPILFSEFGSDTNHVTSIETLLTWVADGAYITDFPFWYSIPNTNLSDSVPVELPNSINPETEEQYTWLGWNLQGNNTYKQDDTLTYFNSNPFGSYLDSEALALINSVTYSTCYIQQEYKNLPINNPETREVNVN